MNTPTRGNEYRSLYECRVELRSHFLEFTCIGHKSRSIEDCENELNDDRKERASELLGEDDADLSGENRRDIIALLLCQECQYTYTQKNKIKERWIFDSPGIDFGLKRSPSPYSLYSRRPTSDRRRSSGLRPSGTISSPCRCRASSRSIVESPPSPTDAALARRRGRAVPTVPDLPTPISTNQPNAMEIDSETEENLDLEHDSSLTNQDESATNLSNAAHARYSSEELDQATPQTPDIDTNPFSPGEASTWAPWMLHAETLRLLWEPLPEPQSKGSIYAVQVVGTPYVKIGLTTRKVRKRLKEINNEHGQKLNINGAISEDGIPLLQLYRLEKLVHADLAYFQRDLRVEKPTYRRTHKEYFEVNIAKAEETIRLWWFIMQSLGLEPGTKVDSKITKLVREAIRNIDTPPAGSDHSDIEWWKLVNDDHSRRISMWRNAFKLDDGGFKKIRVATIVLRLLCAAVLLCWLYSRQTPSWVNHTAFVLCAVAGVRWEMDAAVSDRCITKVTSLPGYIRAFVGSVKHIGDL